MELLDRVLSLMPASGSLDARCHLGSPWRLEEAAAGEREIRYHVLLRGTAVVEAGGEERDRRPLHMKAGDILLLPGGDAHALHDGGGGQVGGMRRTLVDGVNVVTNRGGGDSADILCGWLRLPAMPPRLLRDNLPRLMLVSSVAEEDTAADAAFAASRLARLVELMREEAFEQQPGHAAVVNQLSGALFALALRCASQSGQAPPGLLALAQRPRLQAAVAAMFDAPQKPWTLPDLAALCSMSRATFVRHFEAATGRPPAALLTEIRMAIAGRRLLQTQSPAAEVGEAVGYRSEAAFQRVFKQHVGMTPAQWRKRAKREALGSR